MVENLTVSQKAVGRFCFHELLLLIGFNIRRNTIQVIIITMTIIMIIILMMTTMIGVSMKMSGCCFLCIICQSRVGKSPCNMGALQSISYKDNRRLKIRFFSPMNVTWLHNIQLLNHHGQIILMSGKMYAVQAADADGGVGAELN